MDSHLRTSPVTYCSTGINERCRHKYDGFEVERATTADVINEAVDVDYRVGAMLGRGGFGLVKEGVS